MYRAALHATPKLERKNTEVYDSPSTQPKFCLAVKEKVKVFAALPQRRPPPHPGLLEW